MLGRATEVVDDSRRAPGAGLPLGRTVFRRSALSGFSAAGMRPMAASLAATHPDPPGDSQSPVAGSIYAGPCDLARRGAPSR